ncbi:MAG: hypothetical protein GY696_19485 [Gammaproteobacteria bacterium]|nr:hypothetical protein [Gammaproteobacteria bacterium]
MEYFSAGAIMGALRAPGHAMFRLEKVFRELLKFPDCELAYDWYQLEESTSWTNEVAIYAVTALDPEKYHNMTDGGAEDRFKRQLAACAMNDVLPAMLGDDMVKTVGLQWAEVIREVTTSAETTIELLVKYAILLRLDNAGRPMEMEAALLWAAAARAKIVVHKLGLNWYGMLPRAVCWYAQDEISSYVQHLEFTKWFPGTERYACPWVTVSGKAAKSERQVADKFPNYRPEGNTFDRASGPVTAQVPSVPNAFLMYPGLKEKIPPYHLMDIRGRSATPASRIIVPSQSLPSFPRNPTRRQRSKSLSRRSRRPTQSRAGVGQPTEMPVVELVQTVQPVPHPDPSRIPGTSSGAVAASDRRSLGRSVAGSETSRESVRILNPTSGSGGCIGVDPAEVFSSSAITGLKNLEGIRRQRVEKRKLLSDQVAASAKRPASAHMDKERAPIMQGRLANVPLIPPQEGASDADLQHVENTVASMMTSNMEDASHLQRLLQQVQVEQDRRDGQREDDRRIAGHLEELRKLVPDSIITFSSRTSSNQ